MKSIVVASVIAFACTPVSVSAAKPRSTFVTAEQCMTANLFFEARGESVEGMKAVAKVTMNRKKSKRYPNTVCKVVFQPMQFSFTHQQSWESIVKVLHGDLSGFALKDRAAYQEAAKVAQKAVKGQLWVSALKDSLWYHTDKVNPKWNRKMTKVAKIGNHLFFSET